MRSKILFLFFFPLSLIVFNSCAVKKINPLQYADSKIIFGGGGGFAGIENSYMLLDNGNMYKLSKMGQEYQSLGKIELNKSRQIFQTYKLFKFGDMELNDPGNMYKFIELSYSDSVHRITWGNHEVDDKLNTLHAILMNHVKLQSAK